LTAWHPRRSTRVELFALIAVLTGTACTLLVDRDRQQCLSDDDCRKRGGAFAGTVCVDQICELEPTLSCVGAVNGRAPSESRKLTVVIRVRDMITEQPMAEVTGRLCRKLDLSCSEPVGSDFAGDQNGNMVVPVDVGFDGYVELRARDMLPGLYFFHTPVDTDRADAFVPLLSPAVLARFAQLNGRPLSPDRGHVMVTAQDCQNRPAEGLRLSTLDGGDDQTTPFYVVEKSLVAAANVAAPATDRSGRGGFINVRPGAVTLAADLAAPDDRRAGTASVLVRSGVITYTSLSPR
jgi:hypothetical protein